MPVFKSDSEFARKRDQVNAEVEAKRQQELREAVDREPERFVSPDEFLRRAAELGLDKDE